MKNTSKNERKNVSKSTVKGKAVTVQENESISELQNVPIPFHQLPTQMIVAIDGWAQSGKNTAGELVAAQIDGVLVDSGWFYRALTKAALDAGYGIREPELIGSFTLRKAHFCFAVSQASGGGQSAVPVGWSVVHCGQNVLEVWSQIDLQPLTGFHDECDHGGPRKSHCQCETIPYRPIHPVHPINPISPRHWKGRWTVPGSPQNICAAGWCCAIFFASLFEPESVGQAGLRNQVKLAL